MGYSQKDLEDFRKRNSDIAAGMAFGDIIEGDEHTYRGLELHDCRKCKKVFLEQEKQLRKGVVDPNIIADVYKKNGAKECQNKAHRKGLLDYNDAYNRRCCDANALDNKNNNSNKTKPKKNLILKTSKIKMKEIMLCFKKSQKIQKQNNNNNNKIKNGDDEHVIKSKHDDYDENLICDETITNDKLIDEIYWPCS